MFGEGGCEIGELVDEVKLRRVEEGSEGMEEVVREGEIMKGGLLFRNGSLKEMIERVRIVEGRVVVRLVGVGEIGCVGVGEDEYGGCMFELVDVEVRRRKSMLDEESKMVGGMNGFVDL